MSFFFFGTSMSSFIWFSKWAFETMEMVTFLTVSSHIWSFSAGNCRRSRNLNVVYGLCRLFTLPIAAGCWGLFWRSSATTQTRLEPFGCCSRLWGLLLPSTGTHSPSLMAETLQCLEGTENVISRLGPPHAGTTSQVYAGRWVLARNTIVSIAWCERCILVVVWNCRLYQNQKFGSQ